MSRWVRRRMLQSILVELQRIEDYLTNIEPGCSEPTSLWLEVPERCTEGGTLLTNIALKNTEVTKYRILAKDADGNVVSAPTGDTFTVSSPDTTSWTVSVSTMADGSPAVEMQPLVREATGLAFEVKDSAGLTVFDGLVDISTDHTARAIGLDLQNPETTAQPEPAA
jgi:hypothetical protein